jgi:electron transfer flavoprotein beta subunit
VKIVVLVKQVPDTWGERRLDLDTGWLDRASGDAVIDEIDERALEVALSYQDANDAEVVALTMGPDSAKDMLRKALAMGADSAIHIVDDQLAGADAMRTSRVIAAALTKFGFDLVIAGNESTDGRGGVIPTLVAEHLGVPQATFLNSVAITAGSVSGERGTENGTMSVRAPLPAVISVTERSAEPRFPSFKGIMRAKRKPIEVWTLGDLGLDAASTAGSGHSVIVSTSERPARSAGTKIVDDGTAGVALADFLAAGHLI